MRTENMEVDGDPDKSCSHTHGEGNTNWWIRIQGMWGIFLLSLFFCEFEIILKVFKTGSDKKESKDGMYRQHSGTRSGAGVGEALCMVKEGLLLKGRDITVCCIVVVVALKPSLWCQRERSHSHILAFQIRNDFFHPPHSSTTQREKQFYNIFQGIAICLSITEMETFFFCCMFSDDFITNSRVFLTLISLSASYHSTV